MSGQCCGTCKWWRRDRIQRHKEISGECLAYVPIWVDQSRPVMFSVGGCGCPTYAPREESK